MKKRVSLVVLLCLILALLAEAILTLLQAFQEGRIRFRGPRRSWIALPPSDSSTAPRPAQRTATAVQALPAARPASRRSHAHQLPPAEAPASLRGSTREAGSPW